jgi:hypothetical protein
MGLISGLLTLPLAPVRGTVWLAEQIRDQAEAELYDEGAIHEQFGQLQAMHDAGEIDDDELMAAEDALLERLVAVRALAEERNHGGIDER